jgi:ATP-binding cassette subfamily G (WHITE) protein 2
MGSFQPVILTFSEERLVFLKEVNGKLYGVTSYFLGKTIPEIIPIVLMPILMGIIVYWMVGLNYSSSNEPLILILISIVLSFCGNSMGLALGSAISQPKVI